jgi:hypothetical protein
VREPAACSCSRWPDPFSAVAAEIRVVGCDLLGPDFAAALRAEAQRQEHDLTLALDGSHGGRARFEAGAADLALLVLRPEETPPAPPHRSVPLGYFTTVVLVPAASPLTEISLGELAGIFGADAPADHSRWGDLGLGGKWAARAIRPQALAPELSSALVLTTRSAAERSRPSSAVRNRPRRSCENS